MSKAFVLMTALPPTTGHLNLIRFASEFINDYGPDTRACGRVTVIVCTQPDEPYAKERYQAIRKAVFGMRNVDVVHLHRTIEQDCNAPGFWDTWKEILCERGLLRFPVTSNDFIIASEPYGKAVADVTGAIFMPYDMERTFTPVKATNCRNNPVVNFADIIPEFQRHLITTVTIFGAESTGKTTLAKRLGEARNVRFVFEYARPMLENTSPDINVCSMNHIWKGQKALQNHVHYDLKDKPVIVQDTDLFSTVGYWMQPHWEKDLGPVPQELIDDAIATKSDLYIMLKSNIPFEEDPIRYGGDKRESPDEFWESVARLYNLPYVVLDSGDAAERYEAAVGLIVEAVLAKTDSLYYERQSNE